MGFDPLGSPSMTANASEAYYANMAGHQSTLVAGPDLDDLANGQKFVIYAIIVDMFAMLVWLSFVFGLVPGDGITWMFVRRGILMVGSVMSILGVFQMKQSLGLSTVWLPTSLVPGVGLVALLILNVRATGRLKRAGYTIGLMGATR